MEYHRPVLLEPSIDALIKNKNGIYIDCTFGGGGHSKLILEKISAQGKLFSFDQDQDAVNNKIPDSRFTLIEQNFQFIKNYLHFYNIDKVDGILADLGVSSHQLDMPERGFSTRFEGVLDMRMNKNQSFTAKSLINEYSEEELARVFFSYGELANARKIARKIIESRIDSEIITTTKLKEILKNLTIPHKQNKFFAQIFQALRIEVNDEMTSLKNLLVDSLEILKPKGTLVIISYHSLEDRIVKKFIKTGLFEGEPLRDIYGNWDKPFDLPFSKAIIPDENEVNLNPRARSAKMRIGIRRNG